ncbi:hypothetical protein BpHYR1_041481 [Brachionus plicatilis]|uniref:Uncharacterized protein n=1 Tax=Brachionus plicatilis TaxID=10195 RepID=A0A3M7RVZ0_BRAPC|nr:hypothetical protein BpHYR1_041481 [Brachionus plicatilis]
MFSPGKFLGCLSINLKGDVDFLAKRTNFLRCLFEIFEVALLEEETEMVSIPFSDTASLKLSSISSIVSEKASSILDKVERGTLHRWAAWIILEPSLLTISMACFICEIFHVRLRFDFIFDIFELRAECNFLPDRSNFFSLKF